MEDTWLLQESLIDHASSGDYRSVNKCSTLHLRPSDYTAIYILLLDVPTNWKTYNFKRTLLNHSEEDYLEERDREIKSVEVFFYL